MSGVEQNVGGAPAAFTDRWLEVADIRIKYREGGRGKTVIILHGGDLVQPSPLEKLLSAEFRVLALMISNADRRAAEQSSDWARMLPHALAHAAGVGGSERLALVSTDANAPLALRLTLEQSERIDALVLIAPQPIFPELRGPSSWSGHDSVLANRLAEIKAPTLLLLGTEDEVISQQTGRIYAERLPNCYYVLVYDAGHSIETERPQTLLVTIRDFLEHRETFVVNRASTVLDP
jgi:pimeloyl-ACP methyl ester carboxylesterase